MKRRGDGRRNEGKENENRNKEEIDEKGKGKENSRLVMKFENMKRN